VPRMKKPVGAATPFPKPTSSSTPAGAAAPSRSDGVADMDM
jgi:hypothetical protein